MQRWRNSQAVDGETFLQPFPQTVRGGGCSCSSQSASFLSRAMPSVEDTFEKDVLLLETEPMIR
jgi:hypothetical protein